MLSKCANPECSEQFRYLHQGKLFHLNPTPELQALGDDFCDALYERFWLCEQCCKRMRVVWDGTQARIASLLATERVTVRIRSIGCNHLESVRLLPVVTGGRVRGGGGIYDCRRKKNAKCSGNHLCFPAHPCSGRFLLCVKTGLGGCRFAGPCGCKAVGRPCDEYGLALRDAGNPPEIDLERHDAKDKLSAMVGEFDGDRKIDTLLVRHGPIAQAILALAGGEDADLVVVGTHGRGGLSKLALGSVAEELLRISPNPVMTVGPKAEITPGLPLFQTILFATDFGKG